MDYVVQLAILVYWTIGIYVHGSIYMAVLMRQFHPSKIRTDAASQTNYFTCTDAASTQIADGNTPV